MTALMGRMHALRPTQGPPLLIPCPFLRSHPHGFGSHPRNSRLCCVRVSCRATQHKAVQPERLPGAGITPRCVCSSILSSKAGACVYACVWGRRWGGAVGGAGACHGRMQQHTCVRRKWYCLFAVMASLFHWGHAHMGASLLQWGHAHNHVYMTHDTHDTVMGASVCLCGNGLSFPMGPCTHVCLCMFTLPAVRDGRTQQRYRGRHQRTSQGARGGACSVEGNRGCTVVSHRCAHTHPCAVATYFT